MFRSVSYVCFVLFALALGGCGGDEVAAPGEEVVTNKWKDPVDIGKEYTVKIEDIEFGKVYTLDTGESVTFDASRLGDGVQVSEDGLVQAFLMVPVVDDDGNRAMIDGLPVFEQKMVGVIVPEGPPIVSIWSHFTFGSSLREVTPGNNYQDRLDFGFAIKIDRVLDYNLPIYFEYQTQDREELEGEVRRVRFLTVVLKGDIYAKRIYDEGNRVYVGSRERHERASISILPHTDMEKINLPVDLDIEHSVPLEDRRLLEGHVFRPYRIASSSFLMGEVEIERNW